MFKSRQSLESNWGPCGRKEEILPTAPTTPYPAWQRFFPPLKRRKRNLCMELLDAVQKFGRIN